MLRIKDEYKGKLVSDPNSGSVLIVNEIPENTFDYYNKNGLSHLFEKVEIFDGVGYKEEFKPKSRGKKVKYKASKKITGLEDESNSEGRD